MTNQPHKPTWYITTAIPYVNAQPHIGHALEYVQTDALARAYRQRGLDVRFQTGTDENSLKNVQAAEREGLSTAELVARNAQQFAGLRSVLNLSFDDFIRTSAELRHVAGVYKLWRRCAARGDIYVRAYRGLYCVGCEQFYDEAELVDGRCPTHGTVPEAVEEENYFFRLSRYADELLQRIEAGQLCIVPESRQREVISFIRRGLHDFSISRSHTRARGWGIPVPDDPSQVIYVWFDALANYISALGYGEESPAYQRYWANSAQRIHVIGKDITRFHAIYWPAMLLSAGLPLPTTIVVHGFLTVEGRKISKSLGNAVDPTALVEQYGADAVRYFLLRKIPASEDGDYSAAELARAYTGDLADQLGNLVSRVITLIRQNSQGIVPAPGPLLPVDQHLVELATETVQQVPAEIAHFALPKALTALWRLIEGSNKYVVTVEPWVLARRLKADAGDTASAQRLATTLAVLAEALRLIALLLDPFLPATAAAIRQQLGLTNAEAADWPIAARWGQTCVGAQVEPGPVLFPKTVTAGRSPDDSH